MIELKSLISLFKTMYEQHWEYRWGIAEKGCVDCSGAFVYAYKTLGNKSISHGSNSIARKWTASSMLPISMAEPGMAAFKVKNPGEDGYDLPERYRQNGAGYTGDLGDYYHIGLVDSDTRYVLNAKGTQQGFCRDNLTAKNGWDFVAYLQEVDYQGSGKGETRMDAKVVLPAGATGETVNMRDGARKDAKLIMRVPVGSVVEVLTDQAQWCKVEYSGRQGWMMSNYLEYSGQDGESGDGITAEDREKIETALQTIEKQIEIVRATLGRG